MEKNQELLALEKALTISGFLDTIECLIRDLEAFCLVLPREYKIELGSYIQILKSIYTCLDGDSELEDMLSKTQTLKEKFPSTIMRLGKHKELLALSEQGKTQKEIAEILDVSSHSVSRFLKYYKNSTAIEKVKIQKTDVFDIYNNLQELYAAVLRQYSININDPLTSPKILDTWLKVIREADKVLDKWSVKQQVEEMMYKNRVVIMKYVPAELQEACANELKSEFGLYKSGGKTPNQKSLQTVDV